MALDSITLYHLLKELKPTLVGTRIDKVQQPEKEEVHLLLRSPGKNLRLLLNAGSTSARLHLTGQNKKNPVSPPMFCMILRKHLEGGKIIEINQCGLERIITVTIQNYNERGDLQDYQLTLEIMGKHSNLILVDPQTNVILDGIRRYSHLLSRHREVLPGRLYISPPSQHKAEAVTDEQEWMAVILGYPLDRKVCDVLVNLFDGISPELAKELILRASLEPDVLLDNCGQIDLSRLFQAYSFFLLTKQDTATDPCVYYQSGRDKNMPAAFTFIPYVQYEGLKLQKTLFLNDAVDLYYTQKMTGQKNDAKKGSLRKVVQDHFVHISKKDVIYYDTIAKAEKGLEYQKLGELLTANLYKLSPGMKEIAVEDYTDPDYKSIRISLDPNLTGINNAQHYYKIYNKAKATIKKTAPLQKAAQEEMNYLQTLALSIDQAEDDIELNEIYQELIDQGYIKKQDRNQTKKRQAAGREQNSISQPHVYLSKSGRPILVGRNNKQNDRMTWREAKPGDLWLHVKNIPGSHIIVPLSEEEEFPDDNTLLDAAALAIYFSQARGSSHVPVDYTHVRQIKKPRGAKPGMVVYEQNWSLLLTPEPDAIERLLATEQ
ncbi:MULTISPECIES: NFACT RNA binding domain-containing protein [unclassified Dehalobacter]|uniref:Rqc2 family fibronectin-binding protein n=1 Tax=unclassified Dehalobacter TaxID=2635733 RepID=UPI0003A130D1|nr:MULTISPECIES: NFACT RNA binding domain-containing protein [unclassified Dehalobacter]RJE49039.1 hypothetical protein A7K50_07970 [Dehalobacter sp. MCB1]TCX51779.1 DUF814 domain-containing protein [Dehalobacter sp. 14DCB1]TCX52839.1 DUF814 domain-containing protein [Dehalobacter sp. 12DCB1]